MKTKLKKMAPYILLLLLVIFYFEYAVTILWDSAHYMHYVNILEGTATVNTWDVVRGPTFPIIIFIGNVLFGKTTQGLLINTFIYYIIMLIFSYKIINYILENLHINEKKGKIIKVFLILSIILNPIVFGFYHSLLTEFVAITISIISCYVSVIWLDMNFININKKRYILLNTIIIFITIFSWFLKQPYVSCGLFPIVVAYLISFFKKIKLKELFFRTVTIITCILSLFLSIKIWNMILINMGNNPTTDRNPTVSFGNTLINGVDFMKINNDTNISNSKLSDIEIKKTNDLTSKGKEYVIIDIYDQEKIIESDYIVSSNKNVSTSNAIIYIFKYFINHPLKIAGAYINNYLSIIDIYSTSSEDGVGYQSNKKIDLKFSNEIKTIAFKPYYYGGVNTFYMLPEMQERVKCYEQTNYVFPLFNYAMLVLGKIYLVLFKISFLLLPIFLVLTIISMLNKNNSARKKKCYNLIAILFGYSMLHMLLHTVTGAIIDRYAAPAFITTYFGIILYFVVKKDKPKSKNTK